MSLCSWSALVLTLAVHSPASASPVDLFEEPTAPPQATFPGPFDEPPAYHFRARLPGGRINAASHAEWGDPVILGGNVLLGSAAGDALYLLSRRDGALVRSYPASNSVEAPATVHKGVIYFSDTGGNTFAYTVQGELLWRHDGSAPILAPPAVRDGMLVVTNVDDLAVALDAKTGELQWQYRASRDLTREAELALYAAPEALLSEDEALLGFSTGALVSVDLETGEERWRRDVGEGRYPDLVAAPAEGATDFYTAGYFEPLVAIDRASRSVRWRLDVGGAYRPVLDPATEGAVLYHPGTDGKLRAVSTLTGAEMWVWDSGTTGAITTPQITEAGLVVASSEGSIYLIDPSDGREIWRWQEEWQLRGISSVPVVDGRQLLFVSNAGYLYSMLSVLEPEPQPLWP